MENWINRWRACINSEGAYFEGDNTDLYKNVAFLASPGQIWSFDPFFKERLIPGRVQKVTSIGDFFSNHTIDVWKRKSLRMAANYTSQF